MALTTTKIDQIHSQTDASSYAFTAKTYTANLLYVIFTNTSVASGAPPTVTGVASANVTFAEIGTAGGVVYDTVRRIQAWYVIPGSTFAGETVTITCNGTSTGMDASNIEVNGHDTSGTIVQNATNGATSGTSLTVTLSAFGNSNNRPMAYFGHRANEATTEGTGYTELDDGNHASPSAGSETIWHSSSADTTPNASWVTNSANGGFAIEIKAATAAAAIVEAQFQGLERGMGNGMFRGMR